MPFKAPSVNRGGITQPVAAVSSPTTPKVNRTHPGSVRYYSDGNLGEGSPGVFGGFIPEPTPPPITTGYNSGSYDDGTYDS